ncbi:MAG: aminotransferase class IV, partial [Planctomycetales bacterium]
HYYLADRAAEKCEPGARALLLDDAGFVTETSSANIVIYDRKRGLITPPRQQVLPGVSLAMVEELADQLGIPFGEQTLGSGDTAGAEEVLLTSTPYCLLPVTKFNGQPIGSSEPGEIFRRLIAAWSEAVGVNIVAQAAREIE